MNSAAVLFQSLAGHWILERTIEGFGSMDGRACFAPLDGMTMHYREDGQVRHDSGASFSAFREFIYCLEDDDIAVRFGLQRISGGLLFRLHPECSESQIWPAHAQGLHHCGQDTYHGEYWFERPERLRVRIAISGPGKSSVISTLLTKVQETNHEQAAGSDW